MLLNYLLVALYNLKRHPVLSAIKILSLAIGLGCGLLVLMHAQYELSFDRHFPHGENIYRLVVNNQGVATRFSGPRDAPAMRADYPEIAYITRMQQRSGTFTRGEASLSADYFWVEPDILDVFSLQFVSGDAATALDAPDSIVLSESAATKFFGGEEALGQSLTLDGKTELRVTGVMRDLPANTHIDLQVLLAADASPSLYGEHIFDDQRSWTGGVFTYLRLRDGANAQNISADLGNFIERNVPEDQRNMTAGNSPLGFALEPLHDIHLGGRTAVGAPSDNTLAVLFSVVAFAALILLSSCINFANLALVQVQQRSREVGVRRALGASRTQVIVQFLLDSMLLTVVALLLALPAIELAIPVYTALTGAGFSFATAMEAGYVAQMVLFVLATGVLSGLMPALALARSRPAFVIKGTALQGRSSDLPRAGVTVVQFGFSTALILLALAIVMQIRHLNTMDIGFDKDNLLVIDTVVQVGIDSAGYEAMVNELREHPGILATSRTNTLLPDAGLNAPFALAEYAPNEFRSLNWAIVDPGYLDTLGLELIAGRWFSDEFASDFHFGAETAASVPPAAVITREAARTLGFESPEAALDQVINQRFPANMSPNRIIGVVEDFRFSGGIQARSTEVLRATTSPVRVLLLRLDPANQQSTLAFIDELWARHRPGLPINRSFFSDTYNGIVAARTQGISIAATFASFVTIIISAMGLYALVFYSTARRTKEVGIRKVLGATTRMVISLLTWDFLRPVMLACLLACVGGYLAIRWYTQQFSSQVEVTPLLYVLVTTGTLLVAVLIIIGLSYRAASAHPVSSLRYE